MNRISAAENFIIEFDEHRWRLLAFNEDGVERTMLEALSDAPLTYSSEFARSRRLPTNGTLPTQYVWQVVLGWSHDDEAWHLGLLLARDLADARGSRWCQLALWPDPDTTIFSEEAQQVGQALSSVLQRPFNLIPPRERQAVEPPLPELPLKIGLWQLENGGSNQLAFVRSGRWLFSRWVKIAWYTLWMSVYLVLSITTLQTDLALPNAGTMLPTPEVLPYLGLGAAAILLLMILYTLYEIISRPNRIVIDGTTQQVVALHGKSQRWHRSRDELKSIYVTQIVNKRGNKRKIYHGEINLHMGGESFYSILKQMQQDEDLPDVISSENPAQEAVMPLTPSAVYSDLQAAGLYIARTLGGLPAWYDQRTR